MSGDAVGASSSNGEVGKKEHLGIPKAEFIEDVQSYMDRVAGGDPETALRQLDQQLMKYNLLNSSLNTKRAHLKTQIPELEKTLSMIKLLIKKRDESDSSEPLGMSTRFLLADHVYADATIDKIDKVGLWLGVNVMVEYPLDEALELIGENLEQITQSEKTLAEDLLFLRDQITTMEVSMARVYNFSVEKRQKSRQAAANSSSAAATA